MALIITTQKKLERCSLSVSEILGDQVDDYTADGDIYKGPAREQAINKAVENKYNEKLAQMIVQGNENASIKRFLKLNPRYQEFRQITINNSTPNSKALSKDVDIKKVVGVRINGIVRPLIRPADDIPVVSIAGELTAEKYDQALGDSYSNYAPSTDNPWFFEQKDSVRIELGDYPDNDIILYSGAVDMTVLVQPIYVAYSLTGLDINISWSWVNEVSEEAANIILQKQQF